MRRHFKGTTAAFVCLVMTVARASSISTPYENEPVKYSASTPTDAVSALKAKVEAGQVKLAYDAKWGYLPALLKELNVPVSSQMLVFSKTSLQVHFIEPEKPRAIYFNDDVYVGYCQHGKVCEISATDAKLGQVFYTLSQTPSNPPSIARQTHACLQCHDSSSLTLGVPGLIMRSVYPDADGMPVFSAGTFHTTQESPLKERWGGWYVSGTSGAQVHMGNTLVKKDDPEHTDFKKGCNVTDLSGYFDTTQYLTPNSDIVALMVAEHQTTMHNLITVASYDARLALLQQAEMNKALGEKPDHVSDSMPGRLKSSAEPLLQYMLFAEEAPLTEPIVGMRAFAHEFAARGPKDSKGRSLREFDLQTRLFKYPCSYLIYSDAFNALPPQVLDYIRTRLSEIFSGQDTSTEFARLSPADRTALREILAETWKGAPAAWARARPR